MTKYTEENRLKDFKAGVWFAFGIMGYSIIMVRLVMFIYDYLKAWN